MHSRLDHQARIALMQAADEARDLGHSTLGPEHLLLGILADRRSEAADALLAHGLTFEGCRDAVAAHHREHPDVPAADETAGPDSPDHTDPARAYEEDRSALKALGIDLDKVREAVRTTFGDDLAQGWGGRSDRGRGRGRGRGRSHGRGPGGPHGHGRGRRGPRSGAGPFGLPFRDSLKDVLRDLMRSIAVERVDAKLEGRFDGPPVGRGPREEGRGRRGPGRIPPQRLVLALLDSPDPALRAAIAGLDVAAVRRVLGERVDT